MTPLQKQVYDMHQGGMSARAIARELGKHHSTVAEQLSRAKAWAESPTALTAGAEAINADTPASVVWTKTHKDGTVTHSVMHSTKAKEQSLDDILAKIADAFSDVPAVDVPSAQVHNDLLTVYPLYDMHIGMMAWGRETRGQDYDLGIMKRDLMRSISTVQSYAPDSQDALIILGGDTIHINDHFNETPASRHKMDVDGRYEKVVDVAIETISWAIEFLASKHKSVKVIVLRGNHDETSHIVLKAALKQRYRTSENVEFPKIAPWDKSEIYWFKHGKSLIIAHHGDKAPPERLAMIAADKCPHWSETQYRVILTGHLHSLKVKDMPGVTHYTLRAFCPPDAYGAMWGGVRGLSAMSFSEQKGLINTAHDPVDGV